MRAELTGEESSLRSEAEHQNRHASSVGLLFVNADDWGRDARTTNMTLDCVVRGAVSSVSAMVFMEDSERAAAIAGERGISSGLHFNFTSPFTKSECPRSLADYQQQLASYLRGHRLAQVVYHPGLSRAFAYVVAAQLDEFRRLYGADPERVDGHHHMHLCANMLLGGLLPHGTLVRRNFSFQPGEKGLANRVYRGTVDRMLKRRHRMVDLFFSLPPLQPSSRLERIFSLARRFAVELETHPANPDEHRFLAGGEIFQWTGDITIVPPPVSSGPRSQVSPS